MAATDLLERIKAKVGWEGEARTRIVEAGQVRRFCEALGDDNPRWRSEVPPTFVVALGTETPQIPEVLEYGKGWLNGGDRFEYLEPISIGDRITSKTVLKDVYEKPGGSGYLLFLVFDTDYVNQHGRLAVRVRGTRIRRQGRGEFPPKRDKGEFRQRQEAGFAGQGFGGAGMPGQEIPELVKHPTTRQLVRYAGASGDFYEIHYDQDFARSTGLPGVILHGLLKAGFLVELVFSWAGPASRLRTFDVSYRGLDIPGRACRCRGVVRSVEDHTAVLDIWTEDPDGSRTTIGSATLDLV